MDWYTDDDEEVIPDENTAINSDWSVFINGIFVGEIYIATIPKEIEIVDAQTEKNLFFTLKKEKEMPDKKLEVTISSSDMEPDLIAIRLHKPGEYFIATRGLTDDELSLIRDKINNYFEKKYEQAWCSDKGKETVEFQT